MRANNLTFTDRISARKARSDLNKAGATVSDVTYGKEDKLYHLHYFFGPNKKGISTAVRLPARAERSATPGGHHEDHRTDARRTREGAGQMSTEQIERVARIIDAVGWSDHDRLKRAGSPPEVLDALTRGSLHTARAVIAAIHPTITTTEELDKQASETVIRDDAGFVYEQDRIDTGLPTAWLRVGKCHTVSATEVQLPATVLNVGGAA